MAGTPVNPATAGGANACGGCGATLRMGARHCHQCGVKVLAGFPARLILVPVLTALLGGACYALVLLLLAAPLQVQRSATVSASGPPEQRQQLAAERQQLKTP